MLLSMPSPRSRLSFCSFRGWKSLAFLFGSAVVLAWFADQGAWASSFFQSPQSPLFPATSPSPSGLLPGSSGVTTAAFLVGGLALGVVVGIPLLTRWTANPPDEGEAEREEKREGRKRREEQGERRGNT